MLRVRVDISFFIFLVNMTASKFLSVPRNTLKLFKLKYNIHTEKHL